MQTPSAARRSTKDATPALVGTLAKASSLVEARGLSLLFDGDIAMISCHSFLALTSAALNTRPWFAATNDTVASDQADVFDSERGDVLSLRRINLRVPGTSSFDFE